MQLKITRSQRTAGMLSKHAVFCIYAIVAFTAEERQNINRYKLGGQVIYNSESAQRLLDKSEQQAGDGRSFMGNFKSLATAALAAMKLRITIDSLAQGQLVECKTLDELLGAEEAVVTACQNLKTYLDAAATFDGRETLFDFETGQPEIIASTVAPSPMLVDAPEYAPYPQQEAPSEDSEEPIDHSEDSSYAFFSAKNAPMLGIAGTVALVLLIVAIISLWPTSKGTAVTSGAPIEPAAMTNATVTPPPTEPVVTRPAKLTQGWVDQVLSSPERPAKQAPQYGPWFYKDGQKIRPVVRANGTMDLPCENYHQNEDGLYICE